MGTKLEGGILEQQMSPFALTCSLHPEVEHEHQCEACIAEEPCPYLCLCACHCPCQNPNIREPRSVLQDWVQRLSFMQQSVLISAVRGPDGARKRHPAKNILRWYRRCVLLSAFDGVALLAPDMAGGGSFTGPVFDIDKAADEYFDHVDELPHHFQTHIMQAAQIVGYKHPNFAHHHWWRAFYERAVSGMHLRPESEEDMSTRLGDNETDWRAAGGEQ